MKFDKTIIMQGLICLLLFAFATQARAVVTKVITITSSPERAEVKQLKGSRKIVIGKTPLEHEASFHSEKSLLRFEVSKQGFEPQVIKVNALETTQYVKLEKLTEVARSEDMKDATASVLQEKAEEIIKAAIADYRGKAGTSALVFYAKIKFSRQSGDYSLLIPIDLGDVVISETLAKKTWQTLYEPFIYPLSSALNKRLGPTKIRISATSSKDNIDFAPKTSEIETVSMECQGGMTTKYVTTWDNRTTTMRVWDPCAYRLPVTFTQEVIDVDTIIGANSEVIHYRLNTKDLLEINDSEKLYQLINPEILRN